MNAPISTKASASLNAPAAPATPLALPRGFSLKKLALVLYDESRWRLLRELAKGEALPSQELVRRTRRTRNSVQKNLAILKEAGLATQVYGHLYRLAPPFTVSEDGKRLNLVFCELCLDELPR